MENDGYSLDDKRLEIEENDIPDILEKFNTKEISEKSWIVNFDEIKANDWNLSASRYKPYEVKTIEHQEPDVIIKQISSLDNEIKSEIFELKKMIDSTRGE